MAVLTATVTGRLPVGNLFMVTALTEATGAAADDEWVSAESLGLTEIDSIVGMCPDGTVQTITFTGVINARGTGVTKGTNRGDVGIETSAASVMWVTVLGR